MINTAGPDFDELDATIEHLHALMMRVASDVMNQVADELGAVRTAAGKPPPKRIPPEEPAPPPGEPAVSLDTLALIATLWTAGVDAEIMPAIVQVVIRGADVTGTGIRIARPDLDLPTPDEELATTLAQEYLAAARNRMVGFSDVMWEVARAQLLEGFIEGESIDKLRDRLRVAVPQLSAARARTVARTEVISASNAGSLAMIETAGFTGTKSWLSTEDERTRPTHLLADGQTVPIAEAFDVGGAPLFFPGDPAGPPEEVINCRCTITFNLDDEPLTAAGGTMAGEWIGVLTVEGTPTGDGRMFAPDSLTWADLPLPLLWQPVTADGHDGSVIVGNITEIARMNDQIIGRGTFDLATPEGVDACARVQGGYLKGVSIDADNFSAESVEYVYGESVEGEPSVSMVIFHGGRIRGATLCAIPAFVEAYVQVVPDEVPEMMSAAGINIPEVNTVAAENAEVTISEPLTAASYVLTIPDVPPAEWFAEPTDVDIRGALTVTDEGRVYGYLAPAGVAHRSFKERVTVPMRNVDYSLFMGRETLVAGGGRVVTGALTMDCGHASTGYRDPAAAMDHYDNSCSIVATVRIGENDRGVWVAGSLVPGLSANQVSRLMACQLSGDWRPHRERSGWREFAGALLVPVPGFAMSRTEASVRVQEDALVASTVPVEFKEVDSECGCKAPASDFSSSLQELAASIGLDYTSRLDTLRKEILL